MQTAAIAIAAGAAFPGAAFAQAPAEQSVRSGGLGEIVVTAQRKEESLQDVPVAVTALNSETLDNLRVTDVQNLSGLAPNLAITTQGIQSIPTISIRGITSGTSDNAVDPKVGIYLDGVYIGRSVGAIFDLADIERVEVLRGPQGTLFGRNATGGAISLITATPTGEFGVKAMASYGNQDSLRFRTTVNLPQMGPLSVKFSYLHDESHGWMKNLAGGQQVDLSLREPTFGKITYADRLGARNVDAFQAAARLDFGGNLTVDYRFDYTDSKTVGSPVQVLGHTGDLAQLTKAVFAFQQLTGGITNFGEKPLSQVANSTSVQPLTVEGHNLTLTWQASDAFTVKSITGYRKFKQKPNSYDLSGTGGLRFSAAQFGALLQGDIAGVTDPANAAGPNDRFYTLLTARSTSQKQFTQELQGVYSSDAFDLTFGGFYFHERSPALNILGVMQPTINGTVVPIPAFDSVFGNGVNETIVRNSSLAGYAQGTLHISDQLDFSLGGRYTHDKRETELIRSGAPGVGSGGTLPPGTYKKKYNEFTYSAILTYRPSSDITTYAKVSTGYVAGGILGAIPYGPEKVTSYEVGLKSELLDRRLRANLSGYYMDYKDLQIQTFQDGVQRFENAGKARIWGLEAEFTAVPVNGLNLEANFGYQNFKYKEYLSTVGGSVVDVADIARPIYTPKWNMRFSGQYDFPEFSSGGHFMIRLDSRYRSTVPLGTFPADTPEVDALAVAKGHWIVDGRLGLVQMPLAGAKVGVSLWGQNLFDKDDVMLFGPTAIVQTGQFINGRLYGLEVNLEF
ncbi:TonB-dependent receptor [Croceicoccus estronivorus]|nr:TonB-dependent receptor [Croceicoccus estronivorus]